MGTSMAPLITTVINSAKPCYGPDRDRLILNNVGEIGAFSSDKNLIGTEYSLVDIEKDF